MGIRVAWRRQRPRVQFGRGTNFTMLLLIRERRRYFHNILTVTQFCSNEELKIEVNSIFEACETESRVWRNLEVRIQQYAKTHY